MEAMWQGNINQQSAINPLLTVQSTCLRKPVSVCREEMDTSTESQEAHTEQHTEDEEEQSTKSIKGIGF